MKVGAVEARAARRALPLSTAIAAVTMVGAVVASVACGSGSGREAPATVDVASRSVPAARVDRETDDPRPLLVVLGDSLTAGLGLDPVEAYPALLQRRLDEAGLGLRVVNAGVSGDTSAGGVGRLEWALRGNVRLLIVALGANDGLRALPPAELRANLGRILAKADERGIVTIVAGMEAPPNLGRDYTGAFRAVYSSLAKERGVTLVPFLLEGVAGIERLNQADGIHPNAEGARMVAEHLWPVVEPLARQALARPPRGTPRG